MEVPNAITVWIRSGKHSLTIPTPPRNGPTSERADICAEVGATSLLELHGWVRSAPETETDRVLAPLAARAVEGSELAARVLRSLSSNHCLSRGSTSATLAIMH